MSEPENEVSQRIKKGIESDTPKIYFNGFVNAIGAGDVTIVLERNGSPIAVLNTTFTVAKTLALKLNGIIQNLEATTGTKIMTTEDIGKSFGRVNS